MLLDFYRFYTVVCIAAASATALLQPAVPIAVRICVVNRSSSQ
jgi:hypothetical protein